MIFAEYRVKVNERRTVEVFIDGGTSPDVYISEGLNHGSSFNRNIAKAFAQAEHRLQVAKDRTQARAARLSIRQRGHMI